LQRGREEGRLEASQTLEHELFKKLNHLVENKQTFQQEVDAQLHTAHTSAQLLAMTIAKKLAGSLLARYPAEHIEMFFRQCLTLLPHKTNLRLLVAPQLANTLQPRLEALLERNGQQNELQVVEDETIEGVNCKLIWADGGIEQNTDDIFAQIEKMIETCLYAQSQPANNDARSIK
jgi:flagellar biosynthesis/type III secretory pathway protein FliH